MEHTKDNIIDQIAKEYERRKAINPSYSLRAFSRSLGIDQSLLTKILKGKRKASRGVITTFMEKVANAQQS